MSLGQIVSATSDNDVLLGRGSALMFHLGNVKYRELVEEHREEYKLTDQYSKHRVAKKIVAIIRDSGGRFLRRVACSPSSELEESWVVIDESTALEKVKQSLREKRKPPRTDSTKPRKQRGQKDPRGVAGVKRAITRAQPRSPPLAKTAGTSTELSFLPTGAFTDELMALSGIIALRQSSPAPLAQKESARLPSLISQLQIAHQGFVSYTDVYSGHDGPPLLHGNKATDPVKKRQEELFQRMLHR